MAALPRSSYRYKNMRKITFPDPIQEAQVMFRTKPEDMLAAHSANENFLQSISDYKNMITGVDMSNQNLFKSINNKLTDTSLFSGNKIVDKRKLDKLKDLFKNVTDSSFSQMGPALLQFLQTPEVKALIDQAKTGLEQSVDNRIMNAIDPLQTQLNNAVGIPIEIPMNYLIDKFKTADLKGDFSPFEITMDPAGPVKGLMKVFEELDCKSYFQLLPIDETAYKSSINAVNERQQEMQIPLTKEFCEVITKDEITHNNIIKNYYLDLYKHTIKDKVDDVFSQFKSGQVSDHMITDEYAIEENKRVAAEQITRWAKESMKFREWIAKLQPGDIISDAKKFLEDIEEDEVDTLHSLQPTASTLTPSRMSLRSDTRRKEELDQSTFKTPQNVSSIPKVKLSPKGKEFLTDAMKLYPNKTKQELKQEVINMANDKTSDTDYSYFIKDGKGIKVPKVKVVVIPPTKLARFDRIKVILGAIEADSSADYLDEYSAIVDSLLTDKMITKDIHKNLVHKYTELTDL